MILVTLGTQDKSFTRLLEALDNQVNSKLIDDEIIVQSGHTKYESKNMKIFDFISQKELDELRKKADVIITHAGVGSILDSLKYDKKVIGVARLKMYKEHTNDHQLQILDKFANEGYILRADDLNELSNIIKVKFKPKKYESNVNNMIKIIEGYISKN